MQPSQPVAVYLEFGAKRAFACAVDWPGWCRSGRYEEEALAALAAYASRYAIVALEAGLPPPEPRFDVIERLAGSATTDFGAPDRISAGDPGVLDGAEAARITALVAAGWIVLGRVVVAAPAALRKGPRGGGRDRDVIVQHVLAAEAAYARRLGIRRRAPHHDDHGAIEDLRKAILTAIATDRSDAPANGWPARYAARRIAWHVLDHAWEIEDRSENGAA